MSTSEQIAQAEQFAAHNYEPLPVVISEGDGAWVTDVDGNRYIDMLAGYSALNFGHANPTILAAARKQLDRLTLTSRAFHHDQFGSFCQELSELAGPINGKPSMVLPMNTGAEAVETAIKVARKWGYEVKGVPDGEANIIVAHGNFHGRTTTIVSFSDDPGAHDHYGPYTPGFRQIPYGDADALEAAIDDNTVAILLEPIQGESGVIVPPDGFLLAVRQKATARGFLFIADEIQSGLGRTGSTFACDLVGVKPDLYVLGKALGGGIVPVSAVVGDREVLGVLKPGQHGSTFGGNPLACAVGRTVVGMLKEGTYQARARDLGAHLRERLDALVGQGLQAVRGVGLWAGLDLDSALGTGHDLCVVLAERGVLAKDTHGSTIRLAPPLVIERSDLDLAIDRLAASLTAMRKPG